MYTIKGLMDKGGQSAQLANAKEWAEARQKAAEFHKMGFRSEIWHKHGMKVDEPEDGSEPL